MLLDFVPCAIRFGLMVCVVCTLSLVACVCLVLMVLLSDMLVCGLG
jgi:hypothetical protein